MKKLCWVIFWSGYERYDKTNKFLFNIYGCDMCRFFAAGKNPDGFLEWIIGGLSGLSNAIIKAIAMYN